MDSSAFWICKYRSTNQTYTLIKTNLDTDLDYEFLEEVIKSVRNTIELSCPGVLHFMHSFTVDSYLWTLAEPVDGGNMLNVIKNYCPSGLPEDIVSIIMKSILKTLAKLHEDHAIHNDVRAESIFVNSDGKVYLSNLHFAISLYQNGKLKKNIFNFAGYAEWIAPEVIGQNLPYDQKADIYSFGVTCLELLYGRSPFHHWPPGKILYKKIAHDFHLVVPMNRSTSKEFMLMVCACLKKNPADRPSARELLLMPFFKKAKGQKQLAEFFSELFKASTHLNPPDSPMQAQEYDNHNSTIWDF